MNAVDLPQSFAGCHIALPETRQMDVLAGLLERRGAAIRRCPLISIHDTPNQESVHDWLHKILNDPSVGDLIILTGEGIARLNDAAKRFSLGNRFQCRLAELRLIVRGPKPGRVLKQWGLSADVLSELPTSAGVITTLGKLDRLSEGVGVVLYGSEPNRPLMDAIEKLGSKPVAVAPYVYASESETGEVVALIEQMDRGEIDAIAFTSQPQIDRLLKVARSTDHETELNHGLARTLIAAIGPVMAAHLHRLGIRVDVVPERRYFMKPLVDELAARFARTRPAANTASLR